MQEEIENRTVTLIISAVKLTARELKAGMDKYLSEKKSKAMEKARAAPEKPSGKQTVKQLIGQNQGVSNIEITNSTLREGEVYNQGDLMDRTGVSIVAKDRGTLHGIELDNLYVHDVDGNVYDKHLNNGGIYASALTPAD